MNFQELLSKIAQLDTPVAEESKPDYLDLDKDGDKDEPMAKAAKEKDEEVDESLVDECGMDMPHPMSMPGQQDSVNMSVNMSGSGKGGIKDLLDVLRNLEKESDDEMPVMIKAIGHDESVGSDNPMAPDEQYGDVSDVTATGNDLHSKGAEAPKVNGGGNPLAMESLITKLDSLYQEIKQR